MKVLRMGIVCFFGFACSPPAASPDAGASEDAGHLPPGDAGYDWGDGSARLVPVPITPVRSCNEHCANLGGLCRAAPRGAYQVTGVFTYERCERTHFGCEKPPPDEIACVRPDPIDAPPVFDSLVSQQCGCARPRPITDGGSQVPDAGVHLIDAPIQPPTACSVVCADAGKACALHQWDFRNPSHALSEYDTCSLLAECDETPEESVACLGGTETLRRHRCACK